MIEGYKAFENGLITQFGDKLEIGKKYKIDGKIAWNNRGYHFCSYPEDTLRYFSHLKDSVVAKVHSNGKCIKYDDEYFGYYDMYVSNELIVDRILNREELFNLILSRYELSIRKMIVTLKLTQNEIDVIMTRFPNLVNYIEYYQFDNKSAFKKTLH